MPNWSEILSEIQTTASNNPLDHVRRKYLKNLHEITGRNIIAYYSGWLERGGVTNVDINDLDKNGFMTTIYGLDRTKGLDLILHTPGGQLSATESIVNYLQKMFDGDIRAIIPQIAMSAGTMIACSCKTIIMGKQSNIGPIDPQFNGIPAYGVIEEFNKAKEEIKKDPATIPLWQQIISKYHPSFIGECQQAIKHSAEFVEKSLEKCMFKDDSNAINTIKKIVSFLNEHKNTKTHSRHFHIEDCKNLGLKVIAMEDDQNLQDAILTIHHCYMHSFSNSAAIKIIENHLGNAIINNPRK